ncbi:MAG TPA: oxygen-independent coproporphyrinogen III oxidase, partial [Arenicellales bacterium]|nr:oxygen-independent coproporphyrinogen III oxidase [Arenicellales bacterium]
DQVQLDWDLIRRYDTRGPRYTSYPTALQFTDGFSERDYVDQVRRSRESADRPLSVYIHIPFCEHLCFYCACNKIATRNRSLAEDYLEHLLREIDLRSPHFGGGGHIEQLHFGGGTPTFLTTAQLDSILDALRKWFSFSDDAGGDYSIEIDPRTVSAADMHALRELGFNRVSLGVQDFDPAVQLAVHRIQPREQTLSIMQAARDAGIRSVNVDLIYGLPKQSVASMRDTLGRVIEAAPDRISLFNYAHLPERFPAQRRIRDEDLPDAEEKLEMLKTSVEMVTDAGYVYIGMDHFALPGDELARAKADGTLHRTFQGYTTHAGCELVGFGVSSIGYTGRCFSQNAHDIGRYQEAIANGRIPVAKGVILDDDDVLRAEVINKLMCFGELDLPAVERRYGIDFAQYFDEELARLARLQSDGLVRLESERISVTPRGWMLVRNICASFDRYLPEHEADRFSRTI